MELRIY